ncbi:hypothetical protein D1868_04550 [Stygiolobus azoricus]|uniref:B box-type domain-containing protein n=1 Tax=Stygiolobus azoricus TaxID=41675 RepID=A0A650CN91_9CREN|nr:hypothetical protein D1868_04550 [Stygiolobus azoricus]
MKKLTDGLRDFWKCEICEENSQLFVCKICRRKVCLEDFVITQGICKVCEMSLCQICRRNLSIGKCENCGRIICQSCTEYFDGARRYCKECWDSILNQKGKREIYLK